MTARLALIAALCLAACSVDPLPLPDAGPDGGSGRVCSPGAQIACACVGGAAGAQVCRDDGGGYEACACPDAGGGVDATAVDAGAVDSGRRDTGPTDSGPADAGPGDVGADVVDAGPSMDCGAGYGFCDVDGSPPRQCVNLADGNPRGQFGLSGVNCGACGNRCEGVQVCCGGRCFAPDADLSEAGIPNCSRFP